MSGAENSRTYELWLTHTDYLARYKREHGYDRESDHHGILVARVDQWRGRWDLLRTF